MECTEVLFSRHAMQRMYERGFDPHNIALAISAGEVIVSYPDDRPFPSVLLLGVVEATPIHVVVAKDGTTGDCYVVTVYVPDPLRWTEDFRIRRIR